MAVITETQLRAMLPSGIPNPFPVIVGDLLTPAAADFLKERGILLSYQEKQLSFSPAEIGKTERIHPETKLWIPVGVSNRHVHLSPEHLEKLFGPGYKLTPERELSQHGQYAAVETVKLVGPKGIFERVRILGPPRGATQVEITRSDGYQLGIHAPLRLSGDHRETPGITLEGKNGSIKIDRGVIVAQNHVHMSPADASKFGVADGNRIVLQATGERPIFYPAVVVRVNPRYSLDFHIDLDEANAGLLSTGDVVRFVGKGGGTLYGSK